MDAKNASEPRINRKGAFWSGLFLATTAIALIALSVWFISFTHSDYHYALLKMPPIFFEETGNTVFYMAPFAYLGLFVIGVTCMVVAIRGKAYAKPVYAKVNRVAGFLVVTGVIGMFAGSYLANQLWAEHFENNGYFECPNSFTLTSKWFKAVWVKSHELCFDEEVREMLHSYKHDLTDINSYLLERLP